MLRVGPVTTLAEYFLICTGESQAQLNAIADAIAESLAKQGHHPIGQERDRQGKWILLDYGDVVAHVMHPQAREFYDLESFWSHAAAVDASQWSPSARQAS
ncbi:MAG: ribosome silencing factor [Vampirovibrionales bacterium]|nr:ribosome silencing factor [Vampirovibrionales bacterium]